MNFGSGLEISGQLIGFFVLRERWAVTHRIELVWFALFSVTAAILAGSTLGLVTDVIPELPKGNWLRAPLTKQFMTLREIGAAFQTGPVLIVIKILVFGPIWEEMIRTCLQKGLTVMMPESVSLVLVALYYAIVHDGRVLEVLPSFIIFGVLLKLGVNWACRSIMHGLGNFFVLLNSMTFNFGGYYLDGKNPVWMFIVEIMVFGGLLMVMYVRVVRPQFRRLSERVRPAL